MRARQTPGAHDSSCKLRLPLAEGTFRRLAYVLVGGFIALICMEFPAQAQVQDPAADKAGPTISFTKQIKPIFDNKCILCHSCYDAPCQLNLTSAEGAQRGSSKVPVYNAQRLSPVSPTRLYIDAQTTKQWRGKGFFSVLEKGDDKAALMSRMIELGNRHRFPPNKKVSNKILLGFERADVCAKEDEFDKYAKNRPLQGMPMATTGLSPKEYPTLKAWLAQGAPVDQVQARPTKAESNMISVWEKFLNGKDERTILVARYLYEHLFLAHLYFDERRRGNFFELVRSQTPPGEPVKPVATVRPNDAVDGPLSIIASVPIRARSFARPISPTTAATRNSRELRSCFWGPIGRSRNFPATRMNSHPIHSRPSRIFQHESGISICWTTSSTSSEPSSEARFAGAKWRPTSSAISSGSASKRLSPISM